MQQPADLLAEVGKELSLVGLAMPAGRRSLQAMLHPASQIGQIAVPDRRGVASQGVGQRNGGLTDRAVQFVLPFGDLDSQAAGLLVGFVEKDVEQGDLDAQRPDQLVAVGVVLGRGGGLPVVRDAVDRL